MEENSTLSVVVAVLFIILCIAMAIYGISLSGSEWEPFGIILFIFGVIYAGEEIGNLCASSKERRKEQINEGVHPPIVMVPPEDGEIPPEVALDVLADLAAQDIIPESTPEYTQEQIPESTPEYTQEYISEQIEPDVQEVQEVSTVSPTVIVNEVAEQISETIPETSKETEEITSALAEQASEAVKDVTDTIAEIKANEETEEPQLQLDSFRARKRSRFNRK